VRLAQPVSDQPKTNQKPTKTNLNQMLGNVRQQLVLASGLPGPKNQNPTKPTKTNQTQSQKPLANQQTNQVIENTPQFDPQKLTCPLLSLGSPPMRPPPRSLS
jgi:hypothetical protein